MIIKNIKTGYLKENCYILIKDDKCIIIDPGDNFELIKKEIGNNTVKAVLITHNHFDHVGALKKIIEEYNSKVYDKFNLKEEIIEIDSFTFEVIYNPGHSKDSISFYFKENNIIFVGDFIFKESIGRCDLEGGNELEMIASLNKFKNKFINNKDIIIYPGHGEKTILEKELKNNIYLKNIQ